MKVVHIGANTTGGAGLGMMGVHKALLAAGVDSKVVTMRVNPGEENSPDIQIVAPEADFKDPVGDVVQNLRKKYHLPVSSPYSGVRVEDLPWVKEADVIHLHWVSGLVNLERFFAKVDKPIIWTIRDENAMMGLYHFDRERPVNPTAEECCVDEELKRKKVGWITGCRDLTYVSLCQGMKVKLDASSIGGRESYVIPNRIDTDVFKPRDRAKVRDEFSISPDESVILFAAQFLGEKRKGLRDLLDALERIVTESRPMTLLCVGHGKIDYKAPPYVRIINAGPTADQARMAEFYSVADLFVTPSYSETFGKTTAEAIACGTPVVSYPNIGACDIVDSGVDGFLAEGFNYCALARAIEKAFATKFDRAVMIARIKERYSQEVVARKHLELYEHIISVPQENRCGNGPVAEETSPSSRKLNPRLSIITICYNNVEGLRETLWSTLHEQYGFDDFEQIVVDGGSIDGTADVLEEYKDRLGWYCSEPDKGIYDAMNKGAEHARGEYLLFLNSGDVLLTDMLKEAMREPFTEDLVYSDIYFTTDGKLTKSVSPSREEMTPGWFLFNSLPHQATFIRRDLHNKLGGYDATMKISAAPKFILQALFDLHCTYRKLDCTFSVFDRSGISSQPKMLRPKLQEWLDFLTPYYGKRVAGIAMRWLTVSKAVDWEISEFLKWHPEDFDAVRDHIKRFIAPKKEREAAEKKFNPAKKLSIITVCKNNKSGLEATLRSVLEQQHGFTDFEQIVVDGGSTDGSADVIKKYAKQLSWSCSEKDAGIYNAMNKGVRHSTGEYLLFLNSGDVLKPNVLQNIFAATFSEDIVYADMYFSNGSREWLTHQADLNELTDGWFVFNTLPHQAAFIRRTLHERLGGYDEALRISAAPKFFFEAVVRHRCTLCKLAEPFSVYDSRGISSNPRFATEKASDWGSFLAPYYGEWVAARAMEFQVLRAGRSEARMPTFVYVGKSATDTEREVARMRKEASELHNAFAYRVGMFVTWPAWRAYRMFKCYRENGFKYTLRRLILGKGRGRR